MINKLKIILDREVSFNKNNSLEYITVVEDIRDNIIKFSNNEIDSVREIINNSAHTLPSVIYASPYKDAIYIYGLGDNGSIAINSIFKNVLMNQTLKIKNDIYKIKGIPTIESNIDLLPYNNGSINTYTTLTPINIFNQVSHKVFKAILHRHFPDGKFDKSKEQNVNSFYDDIKKEANIQIKDSIANTVSTILKKEKSYFEFIKNIEIEWEDIQLVFNHYHSQEKKMPMVIGKFRSNFVLPRFIGYKIGKGFGEIILKDNYKRMESL